MIKLAGLYLKLLYYRTWKLNHTIRMWYHRQVQALKDEVVRILTPLI